MEDDSKAAGNSALGKSADSESVLGVELGEYEVAIAGLEYPLTVYVGVLHKTNPSSILSTEIVSYAEITVKSIVVPFLSDKTQTSSCCPGSFSNS